MSATEQRYPVIDKEALAIVWAVKKFFNYLYARKFTLVTDHKPLTQILHPEKSLPTLCISRMANYADYLAHFNFDVVYRSTNENKNADYCSRIPSPSTQSSVNSLSLRRGGNEDQDDFEDFVLNQIQQLPIKADQIARETRKDEHLGKILKDLEMGRNLSQIGYKAPEAKYTMVANCLLFEHRVVIPDIFRPAILQDLHAAHIGVVRMKSLARSYVYWPGIDKDIEQLAKSCHECAQTVSAPPKFNQHHWEYPSNPWERVHVDYAGPVAGAMLLIIVDAYSKWVEVKVTHSTTTEATIKILDELFASYGAPLTVVTDNGTQFTAAEFTTFLQRSGVKFHKRSAPYHPATNGQAERYVQTVKRALKAMHSSSTTLQANLNEFLLQYRKVPHSETGEAPAKLFLGRNIRSRLDLVRPQSVQTRTAEKQRVAFEPSYRTFLPGQLVYCLSGSTRMDKWIRGTVVSRLGDLHYSINCNGNQMKRHVDQMRPTLDDNRTEQPRSVPVPTQTPEVHHHRSHYYGSTDSPQTSSVPVSSRTVSVSSDSSTSSDSSYDTPTGSPIRASDAPPFVRRSTRLRNPPLRYSP
uniref:RNA-directed DNA polymerase n=1 Tax=Anopheles gambiae TaxID=7165 RepID=A0A0E4C706_ANOGA